MSTQPGTTGSGRVIVPFTEAGFLRCPVFLTLGHTCPPTKAKVLLPQSRLRALFHCTWRLQNASRQTPWDFRVGLKMCLCLDCFLVEKRCLVGFARDVSRVFGCFLEHVDLEVIDDLQLLFFFPVFNVATCTNPAHFRDLFF